MYVCVRGRRARGEGNMGWGIWERGNVKGYVSRRTIVEASKGLLSEGVWEYVTSCIRGGVRVCQGLCQGGC